MIPQKKQADVEAQTPLRLERVVNPKCCFVIILSLAMPRSLWRNLFRNASGPCHRRQLQRAQTEVYFGQTVKAGALGKFRHGRSWRRSPPGA